MNLYDKLKETKEIILNDSKTKKRTNLINKVKSQLNDVEHEFYEMDYQDLFKMVRMSDRYIDYINSLDFSIDDDTKIKPKSLISKDLLFSLAREIIERINPDYLDEFDSFIRNKRITFSSFPISSNISSIGINRYDKTRYIIFGNSPKVAYIQLDRNFNYSDVASLVHEFMHHTNTYPSSSNSSITKKYTEYISIYYELFALDYMSKEKQIDKNKMGTSWRLLNTYNSTHYFYTMIIIYLYKITGDISYDHFCKWVNENNIHVAIDNFDEYLKKISSMIENNDRFQDIINKAKRYFLGTLLAFSTREEYDSTYVLEFNKSLVNEKCDKEKVEEIKSRYDNLEYDQSAYKGIAKYADEYIKKKSLRI